MSKDPIANKHFTVLEKILPCLIRQGADARFGNRSWDWQELSAATGLARGVIHEAVADLERRSKAVFSFDNGRIKLLGPPDLNIARVYAKAAKAPATPLAKNFRVHGVYLTTTLMPATSWMRYTDPRITSRRQEVVLTLSQALIAKTDGVVRYSSLDDTDDSWKRRAANKSRKAALEEARSQLNSHFRVIRVEGTRSKSGRFTIKKSRIDKNYWRLEQLTSEGRMVARRTDQRALLYDLSITELGVPAMMRRD